MTSEGATSAASVLYERLRKKASRTWKRKKPSSSDRHLDGSSMPFGPGRDPLALGDVVSSLTSNLGWNDFLVESDVLASWPEIVGPDVALHSRPVSVTDESLIVECESTAWATQLRLMATLTLSQVIELYPNAGINQVVFLGPNAPSWKKGNRSVPGRGPRDTYG